VPRIASDQERALIISPGATLNLNGFSQMIANTSGRGNNVARRQIADDHQRRRFAGWQHADGAGRESAGIRGLAHRYERRRLSRGGSNLHALHGPKLFARVHQFQLADAPAGIDLADQQPARKRTISINTNGLSTWNGSGSNANWSTAANWIGSTPANQNSLMFAGNAQQTSTNNFLSAVGQVIFSNGGFSLTGNAVSSLWGLSIKQKQHLVHSEQR